MNFCEVHRLRSVEDLRGVENKLRSLYSANDGIACQALMTMEYQMWRNRVLQQLLRLPAGETREESPHVLAYLCGYKLLFSQHQCIISQLLPDTRSESKCHASLPLQAPQQAPRQLNTNCLFKKRRICHFPRRV